jgi:excisionase family DNA binding protein
VTNNLHLLTSYEVARELGVHHKTISRLLRLGKIPGIKVANRWLIERDTFEAFRKVYSGKNGRPKGYSPLKGV